MAWYEEGTVKVTVNSAIVTGTGTKWMAAARQGEAFVAPDGRLYEVANIASDTSLTLSKPYCGVSATGQQYALAPMQGYVKELADRAAQLLPVLSDLGTASKGTLATSTKDPAPGRVMRNGDWGFGGNSGVDGDQTILSNPVNGIYRSGSADVGKPDGTNSGSSYFKFGWGGTYYGLLYASPVRDSFYMRTVNNGKANAWKELMTVGQFGLGRSGAGNDEDGFPGTDLDTANVGAGMYYVQPAMAQASGLPAGVFAQGTVNHRQAGSGGGQIYLSFNGDLVVRGRRSNGYNAWREVITAGKFGLGGAQANPPNTRAGVNPSGWYYGTGATPWGGGSFFLDFPYGTTSMNAGFRISTDPYSDRFYMNGAVSGKKEYRAACQLVHDRNIVGDVGAGSVVQTGSNVSGTWVRFADGTQICYGEQNFPGNGWNQKPWHYPMAFLSKPTVTASGQGDNGGFATAPVLEVLNTGVIFRKVTNSPENDNWACFHCIAIGRWKA